MVPFPEHARTRFAPLLAQLANDSEARFGFGGAQITPVGYEDRPFSWLCRAAVARPGSDAPALHIFIKIFKAKETGTGVDLQKRVVQDYATTCEVHTFMSQWPALGAVRPVACFEDALTIVTEQVDGETLLDRLQTGAVWFPSEARLATLEAALAGVGRWLRHYQGFRPTGLRHSGPELCDYVDVRLRRLVERRVVAAGERDDILGHLQRLTALVRPEDWQDVAIHADLAPANVLVSHGRVVLLDFAMATRGTRLHDISRLHMQLDLLRAKPQFRPRVIARLQTALLGGYEPGLTSAHPLFRMLSMLHHVNHLGTLSFRGESALARLVSARAIGIHRRWIRREIEQGAR
jgi:hypothetical protein